MRHIAVLGPNPAWQKTLFFDRFQYDGINRAREMQCFPAGKGINFCRAAKCHGKVPCKLIQFGGGDTGGYICRELGKEEMDVWTVRTVAPTRTCSTCLCLATQTMTEIIEPSYAATTAEVASMLEYFHEALEGAEGAAFCGTLPTGTDPYLYGRAARLAAELRKPLLLDSYQNLQPVFDSGAELWLKINADELRAREPDVPGLGGIFVPSSGIVSDREGTAAMAKIFQARGGEIIYNAEVSGLSEHKNGVVIRTRQGGEYEASTLISCSGLMADRLVKMLGLEPGFIICPFRGEYFRLAPEHNQIVNHLIYPIPDPAMPFLGVHLTRMIDGSVTVGPNAVLAFKREGYHKRDFSFSDTLEILGSSGIRRVLQNHLRSGLGEMKNSLCKSGYLRLVQKYCPRLSLSDLQPWPAGVRAQAVSPDGKLIDDFLFVTTPRTIHTCNAPSPAATSAIPIGAHIVSKVQTLLASQSNPGRTLQAARSVDALHAAFNQ